MQTSQTAERDASQSKKFLKFEFNSLKTADREGASRRDASVRLAGDCRRRVAKVLYEKVDSCLQRSFSELDKMEEKHFLKCWIHADAALLLRV